MFKSATILTAIFVSGLAIAAENSAEVPYPAGYRDWHHVKSMVINSGHGLYEMFGGIHHIYGNSKAMTGYREGNFPDGAVIVFDLLEAKTSSDAVEEGSRKVVGVMHKDAVRYAATGGWGFGGFKGDSRVDRAVTQSAAAEACYACHIAREEQGYVFSAPRP